MILVAEDNPDVGAFLVKVLERSGGYEVDLVEDGAQALDRFSRGSDTIEAVILDSVMPGIDGVAVAERIRKINPSVPIIISSGYGKNELRERFGEVDCDGFLRKPYNIGALLGEVRRVLGGL